MSSRRQMGDGTFTPRQFPIDPFNSQLPSRDLWPLDPSFLSDGHEGSIRPKTILVLGEPLLDTITPLLHSPLLRSSLLILVTARSYSLPPHTSPAVTVLRLCDPLLSSDAAAARLVAVLQWADHVTGAWRATKSPPRFQEFTEDSAATGYLTSPKRAFNKSSFLSLTSSQNPLSGSILPSTAPSVKRSLTVIDRKRCAFDAIFNFLPLDMPDRKILKHAILVTTLSRPFLTCTLPAPPSPKSPKRLTLRRRARTAHIPPPQTKAIPAHIVHLIPPTRAVLIHPLESFCLTFSAASSRPSSPNLDFLDTPQNTDGNPGLTPRPFITTPAALLDVLPITRQWTLAELIVCGALDGVPTPKIGEFGFLERGQANGASPSPLATPTRAWLSGVCDVMQTSLLGGTWGEMAMTPSQLSVSSSYPLSQHSSATSESLSWQQSRPTSFAEVDMPSAASPSFSSPMQAYNSQAPPRTPQSDRHQQERDLPSNQHLPPGRPRLPHRSHPSAPSALHSSLYPTEYHRQRSDSAPGSGQGLGTGLGSASQGEGNTPGQRQQQEMGSSSSLSSSPAWPTPPPSSPSTSPCISPDIDAVTLQSAAAGQTEAATRSRVRKAVTEDANVLSVDPLKGAVTGMLLNSHHQNGPKKRKGLFAWMKR